jgi:predicted RNase H-like nuclease
MLFLGVDLAWRESSAERVASDSGVVALSQRGKVVAAGWTVGIDETLDWIDDVADTDTLLFVDAPLVVDNPTGQRLCETQVGQRYGRWQVFANSTNLSTPRLGGVRLRRELETRGWQYSDGRTGPPQAGRSVSECYPYTALVGVEELGYDKERPRCKRPPKGMARGDWRRMRATVCDDLIRRVASLTATDPPLDLTSHVETFRLLQDLSPEADKPYKRREDLLDAVLCAWTALFWWRHALLRSQVLGIPPAAVSSPLATIIAPARPEQRPLQR